MSNLLVDLATVAAVVAVLGLSWHLDDDPMTARVPCSMAATHHPDVPDAARKQCEKS